MDIATTMAAVNYFNMVNTWNMLAMQDTELFTVTENGKEDEMMSGSILDTYIGKDCADHVTVDKLCSLFRCLDLHPLRIHVHQFSFDTTHIIK